MVPEEFPEELDSEKIQEAIERTRQTGKEHAFVRCSDGKSEIVEGEAGSVSIPECESGYELIFHTHTLPTTLPSSGDRLTE